MLCWGYGHRTRGEPESISRLLLLGPSASLRTAQELVLWVPSATKEGDACARLPEKKVACWSGPPMGAWRSVVDIPFQPIRLAVSWKRGCALSGRGEVACWKHKGTPTAKGVPELKRIVDLALHYPYVCGVSDSGDITCVPWVADPGPTPDVVRFAQGLRDVTSLALSYQHGCATGPPTVVRCWGNNQYGQLGRSAGIGKKASQRPAAVEWR